MKRLLYLLVLCCWFVLSRAYAQPINGDAVVTCGARSPSDPVLAVLKVQNANTAPLNVNWTPPVTPWAFHDPTWNLATLGQIFGIALDEAGNIFVTATTAYPWPYNNLFGIGGSGAVYRIDHITHAVTVHQTLYNPNRVGLGNICYDPDHTPRQLNKGILWVTNFEDGKIYGLDAVTGIIAYIVDPFLPDGNVTTFAPRDERLWGIGYYHDTLYFGRWREDMGVPDANDNNEIWAIPLDPVTGAPTGPEFNVITLPNYGTQIWSNPPSDIEFSASGRMLVAERGWLGDLNNTSNNLAHAARLLEYVNSGGWIPGNTFTIGQVSYLGATGNSAGGCDYGYRGYDTTHFTPLNCDTTVWGSGNALHFASPDYIYGEQMLPATGGSIVNSVLLDIDGAVSTWVGAKNYIGDIDIYKNCDPDGECDSVSARLTPAPVVTPTSDCCWDLTITNNFSATFWTGIRLDVITPPTTITIMSPPPGWTSSGTAFTTLPTGSYIPLGNSGPFRFCVNPGGAPPPQKITVTWFGRDGSLCIDTLRIDCDSGKPCGSIANLEVKCSTLPPSAPSYTATFQIVNNTTTVITGASVTAGGATVSPGSLLFPPIAPGGTSVPITVTLTGGAAGSLVCLYFEIYDQGRKTICKFDTCFILPRCKDCCEGHRLISNQLGQLWDIYGTVIVGHVITTVPSTLRSFTATLVSASRTVYCAGITSGPTPVVGTIVNGSFPSAPVMGHTPFGTNTVTWGTSVSGVTVSGALTVLQLSFPPPPPGRLCRDTLNLCIRYTYTDTACVTCDTTFCYRMVRRRPFFAPVDLSDPVRFPFVPGEKDDDDHEKTKGDDRAILGSNGPAQQVWIDMATQTSGTLMIDNPAVDPSDPDAAVTITGLEMEPEVGVDLTSMTDNASQQTAVIGDRVATLSPMQIPIAPGSARKLAIAYSNGATLNIRNVLRIRYTYANDPETYEATIVVYARTPNGQGGDVLAVDNNITLTNVRTYGLQFTNSNATGDKICRVVVSIDPNQGDGDDIVAVGPGLDKLTFGLKAFRTTEPAPRNLLLAEEPHDDDAAAMPLDPKVVVTPIYVTVCGGQDKSVIFNYTTYNTEEDVVSTGTVNAQNPLAPGQLDVDDPSAPGVINSVECVPNPLTNVATFTFTLNRAEPHVWLTITDLEGNTVASIIDGEVMGMGTHRLNYDATALPSGAYLYTLRTATQTQTRKLQIIR